MDNTGYGRVYWNGKHAAHRLAYEIYFGPIPKGMDVCHTCDVRLCIRREHLYAGTRADNMRDMANRRRSAAQKRTCCPQGHEYNGDNLIWQKGKGRKRYRRCRTCRDRQLREHRERHQHSAERQKA